MKRKEIYMALISLPNVKLIITQNNPEQTRFLVSLLLLLLPLLLPFPFLSFSNFNCCFVLYYKLRVFRKLFCVNVVVA